MPSRWVSFQRYSPSLYRQLARGVRPALERGRECRDPLVVLDEFVLAGVGVVDAIDMLGLQRGIVLNRRPHVVPASAGFVQVVVEVCAGGHETVDVPVGNQVRDDHSQPAGAQRSGHAEKDRAVVAEHLLPDAARRRQIASLKRNTLHPREDFVGGKVRLNRERLDWRAEETRFRLHAAAIVPREYAI